MNDPVTLKDIAERLGVSGGRVRNWASRAERGWDDWPKPVMRIVNANLYEWKEVVACLDRHGWDWGAQ